MIPPYNILCVFCECELHMTCPCIILASIWIHCLFSLFLYIHFTLSSTH
jgi:hypothetical protein